MVGKFLPADAYVRRWEWVVMHLIMASVALIAQASAPSQGPLPGRSGNASLAVFSIAAAVAVV